MGKLCEGVRYKLRKGSAIAWRDEFVSGALDGQQLRARGNEFQRGLELVDRAKAVAHAVNEKRAGAKACEVSRAHFSRTFWRVKRVRKQLKSARDGQRG